MKEFIRKIFDSFPFKEKRLWRFFILFFIIALFLINWKELYWLFNQRAVYGELEMILKEKHPTEPEIPELIGPSPENPLPNGEFIDKNDSIEIPKIKIIAPIVFPSGNNQSDFEATLKRGVMIFPNSVLPGEKGVTVILGHSAGPYWPKINYDWVFSNISKLETGDEIFVFFNHQKYIYRVIEGNILEKGTEIPSEWFSDDKPTLVLISCWPPGKNYKRYGVSAVLEAK